MIPDLVPALRRYLVTDARAETVDRLVATCEAAIAGGVTAIQLRAKGWTDRQLYDAGTRLRSLTRSNGIMLIVNDRVDIALAIDADGVHLGVDDLPVDTARRLLGDAHVVGYSPERDEDWRAAEIAGASYLGVGPVYGTSTKHDAGEAIGLAGLQRVVERSARPVIGIGGVTVSRAREVIGTGAVGVAVVSDIFLASDPETAARKLTEAIP